MAKLSTKTRKAQEAMEKQYNKKRKIAVKYIVGDEVLLDTLPYRRNDPHANISAKLANRWQGPYSIKEVLPHDVYRLNLPPNTKLNNSFNTSVLKAYKLTPRGKFPERDMVPVRPGPVNEGEGRMYTVEQITSHDFKSRKKDDKLRFKVLWEGYPASESTWEQASEIYKTAPEAVNDYLRLQTDGTRNQLQLALKIFH